MNAFVARIVEAMPSLSAIADPLRSPQYLLGMCVVVLLVLYGLSVGRTRALISLLAIYVAYVLTILFPFMSVLESRLPSEMRLYALPALFLGLYIICFSILSSSLLRARLPAGEISLVKVSVISVIQLGLLAAMCVSLVSPEVASRMLGPLYRWLGGQQSMWIWTVVSILIMPFMRAHSRRE